jgi:sec-independent protein translocase protein TatA
MFGIGFQEMILILVVVLIFFGPKRLPDLAKSLGKGLAEFKKASEEVKKGIDEAMKEEPAKEEPPLEAAPKAEPFPEGELPLSTKAPQPAAEEKDPLQIPPAQKG